MLPFVPPVFANDPPATDRIIVKLKPNKNAQQKASRTDWMVWLSLQTGTKLQKVRSSSSSTIILRMSEKKSYFEMRQIADRVAQLDEIEYAEPDRWVEPFGVYANDTYFNMQWNIASGHEGGIRAADAWNITTGSNDIVVAIVDSGIAPHSDLNERILPGYDFVSVASMGNDGDGRDNDASDPGNWSTTNDFCGAHASTWHGTHVAGIVGAVANNNYGISGIDWKAKLLPVRVLGRCGGYMSDIADGVRWAAGLSVPGVAINPNPAKIINLSLGATGACGNYEKDAIRDAIAAGKIVVAAAGNEQQDVSLVTPASCEGVIAVAATNRFGHLAPYSNFGKGIFISAPGGDRSGDVTSTSNIGSESRDRESFTNLFGTSMAAPHVSGTASLILAINPELSVDEVKSIMRQTAREFPTGSNCNTSICGAGLLDADAAVRKASRNTPPKVNAGNDQRVNPNTHVTLFGEANDSNGSITALKWTQDSGSAVSLMNSTSANSSFVAPSNPQVMSFTLKATDNDGAATEDSVRITVNAPPTANAGDDIAIKPGAVVNLNGTQSKDDSGIVAYRWSQLEGTPVTINLNSNAQAWFNAPSNIGLLRFRLTVTDQDGLTAIDDVQVTINRPPIVNAGLDIFINPGDSVLLQGSAIDPDGAVIAVSWNVISGVALTFDHPHDLMTGFIAPSLSGPIVIQFSAADNNGLTSADLVIVNVNAKPAIDLPRRIVVNANQRVALDASNSRDIDGAILQYKWRQVSGISLKIENENQSIAYINPVETSQPYRFQLVAIDNMDLSATADIEVAINHAPTAVVSENRVVNANDEVILSASRSTDAENNIETYQWRQTAGTPIAFFPISRSDIKLVNPLSPGQYEFSVDVIDTLGASSTATVILRVNTPPLAQIDADPIANVGEWVMLDGSESVDQDDYIERYSWKQISGVRVDYVTNRAVTGFYMPPGKGHLVFELTVYDHHGSSNKTTVTISANQAPQVHAAHDITVQPGQTVTLHAYASKNDQPYTVRYAWRQTAGISVPLNDADGASPWFVAPSFFGTLRFEVTVSDGYGSTTHDAINVVVNGNIAIDAGKDQIVKPNTMVTLGSSLNSKWISARWSQVAGLAVALDHLADHQISFITPQHAGTLVFQVTGANTEGLQSVDAVEITVENVLPEIEGPKTIYTLVGRDVRFSLKVRDSNGEPPSVYIANLPDGATFNAKTLEFVWTNILKPGVFPLDFIAYDAADPTMESRHAARIEVVQTLQEVSDVEALGVIEFASTEITSAENDGKVIVTVKRSKGDLGELAVSYYTQDDGADAGLDYNSTSGTLYWPDGDTSDRTIVIDIVDDKETERDEALTINLVTPPYIKANQSKATMTITDNDSKCFIATAAYGSGLAEDVKYLRSFRDQYLLKNAVGKFFVDYYYRISPSIANELRQHETARSITRTFLQPLIWLSKQWVSHDTAQSIATDAP